jgi:hypothetical protein
MIDLFGCCTTKERLAGGDRESNLLIYGSLAKVPVSSKISYLPLTQ